MLHKAVRKMRIPVRACLRASYFLKWILRKTWYPQSTMQSYILHHISQIIKNERTICNTTIISIYILYCTHPYKSRYGFSHRTCLAAKAALFLRDLVFETLFHIKNAVVLEGLLILAAVQKHTKDMIWDDDIAGRVLLTVARRQMDDNLAHIH